ncbi:MAG: lipopolysaccharide export system permease protein, partial [Verrucomicrobiota bacterium]
KEVLGLLVNRQASFLALAKAIGLLIPFVMVFALPMGMLTATLLVFGRFSADQELTAVRASGVSLIALVAPVLLLSVACSAVTAVINMQWAPQCRVAYNELLASIRNERPASFIPERTHITDFTNSIIYVRKIQGTNLEDVLIYTKDESNRVESYVQAPRGLLVFDPARQEVRVTLFDGYRVEMQPGRQSASSASETEFKYELKPVSNRKGTAVSDLTFWQLWDKAAELEKLMSAPLNRERSLGGDTPVRAKPAKGPARVDLLAPVRVQIHRQVAFSFSCIAFTMIGIPLGIRAHRRETTFGIAAALVLVLIYYGFFILGQSLETHSEWAPHLILWIPNFIFQAVGGVLLWRANRGV